MAEHYVVYVLSPRAKLANLAKQVPSVVVAFPSIKFRDISSQLNVSPATALLTVVKLWLTPANFAALEAVSTPDVAGETATYAILAYTHYDTDGTTVLADTLDDVVGATDLAKHIAYLETKWAAAEAVLSSLTGDDLNSNVISQFTAALRVADPGISISSPQFGNPVTDGGNNGALFTITNLNDSGAGSFREAAVTNIPRVIKIDVDGYLPLSSRIACAPNMSLYVPPNRRWGWKNYQVTGGADTILYNVRATMGTYDDPGGNSFYANARTHIMNSLFALGNDGNLGILGEELFVEKTMVGGCKVATVARPLQNGKGIICIGPSVGNVGAKNLTFYKVASVLNFDRNPTCFSGEFANWLDGIVAHFGRHTDLVPRDSWLKANIMHSMYIRGGIYPSSASQFATAYGYLIPNPYSQGFIDASGLYAEGNYHTGAPAATQYELVQLNSGELGIEWAESMYPLLHGVEVGDMDAIITPSTWLADRVAEIGPVLDDNITSFFKELAGDLNGDIDQLMLEDYTEISGAYTDV